MDYLRLVPGTPSLEAEELVAPELKAGWPVK
jgi:hypothetical protein